mmetsp:Transcript_52133/g.86457  ORF Transcript_52133/g.86457 Transcript_52133/m.86457 type:complete len:95 (-) Transcript_52133:213-497(-)
MFYCLFVSFADVLVFACNGNVKVQSHTRTQSGTRVPVLPPLLAMSLRLPLPSCRSPFVGIPSSPSLIRSSSPLVLASKHSVAIYSCSSPSLPRI